MGPNKVRSALTSSVLKGYDEIWNIGFAGALHKNLPFGSIHEISFIGRHESDRSFQIQAEGKKLITFDQPLHDPILRDQLSLTWDLVDMEGHAIAEIAKAENIPCRFIKIVSDNADDNTSTSIRENAPKLSLWLHQYCHTKQRI